MKILVIFSAIFFSLQSFSQNGTRDWKYSLEIGRSVYSTVISGMFSPSVSKENPNHRLNFNLGYTVSKKVYYDYDDYGDIYLVQGNLKTIPIKVYYSYRFKIGDKLQLIPGIGLFGEPLSFDTSFEYPPHEIYRSKKGDGGIIMPLQICYMFNHKIGIKISYDVRMFDTKVEFHTEYSRAHGFKIGIVF